VLSKGDIKRYLGNIKDEIDSAYLYKVLSGLEEDESRSSAFLEISLSEERHAKIWEKMLNDAGYPVKPGKPSSRAKFIEFTAGRLGKKYILEVLCGWENEGIKSYSGQKEALEIGLADEEKPHRELLNSILSAGGVQSIAGRESWHKSGGGSLRAAVLGANDGLVSNLSLIMGVAGASMPGRSVLITGIAGLLAGGASMAIGEWLSVQSSREMYERQVSLEKDEIKNNPQEEEKELVMIYEAKGLTRSEAENAAAKIMSNPDISADTLAREELGIDPEELGGSPYRAAATSLCLFAAGAIFPLFPYFFLSGYTAVIASVILSAIALFIIGAIVTIFTGKSLLFSGGRQIALGLISALITFVIGALIGTAVRG